MIKGQSGKGKRGLTAVAGRRDAIADALAECPVGRWVATDELFRYMQAAGHEFEVTRDRWTLYVGDPQYGSLGFEGWGGWNILQARYTLCVLFEYAATVGIVDLAYVPPAGARPDFHQIWGTDELDYLSRYDGLMYVRLTPLGDYVLGCADAYRPAAPARRPTFTVLANLNVVATGEVSFADGLALERYARRTADRVWRLDRERLLAAVEEGEAIAEVRAFPRGAHRRSAAAGGRRPARRRGAADAAPRRSRRDARDRVLRPGARRPARQRRQDARAVRRGRRAPAAGPTGSEQAFRHAVRRLGYVLPAVEHRHAA